jgi:hypothetical protein
MLYITTVKLKETPHGSSIFGIFGSSNGSHSLNY